MKRNGLISTLASFSVLTSCALSLLQPASAATPTYTSQSYYITDYYGTDSSSTSRIYNLGANAPNESGVVILNFGAQQSMSSSSTGYGAKAPKGSTIRSDATIVNMVSAFCNGYNALHSSGNIIVAIGTNNDGPLTLDFTAAGKDWWNNVVNYFSGVAVGRVSTIEGASDLEGWTDKTSTDNWVNGYNNAEDASGSSRHMWDFGDQGYTYEHTWSQRDAWYYAWGSKHDIPLPEIYYQYQADDWQSIRSLYPMTFYGPTSENGASGDFTAQQSYDALYKATNGDYPTWGGYLTTMN